MEVKNKQFFSTMIGEWAPLLSDKERGEFLKSIKSVDMDGKNVVPVPNKTFTMYKRMTPNKIRVVMMGQDPYPDGDCNGIAFARSLKWATTIKQLYGAWAELEDTR